MSVNNSKNGADSLPPGRPVRAVFLHSCTLPELYAAFTGPGYWYDRIISHIYTLTERGRSPFLKSGGMSVYPFTGRDFYAQYLFRDGQIKEIPASIIWHIPDSNYFKTGDPAFPSLSVENQIEAVLKRQKKLFPKPRETQNKSPGKQKTL